MHMNLLIEIKYVHELQDSRYVMWILTCAHVIKSKQNNLETTKVELWSLDASFSVGQILYNKQNYGLYI